jgi:hypothetical protein
VNGGESSHRVTEGAQLARRCASGRCLAAKPLDVTYTVECFAESAPDESVAKCCDRAVPRLDCRAVHERSEQPLPKKPRAHWSQCSVEDAEQSSRSFGTAHRLDELEVAASHFIERHHTRGALDLRAGEVGSAGGLELVDVAQQCAGRSDYRGVAILDSKRLERSHPKPLDQKITPKRGIELPALSLGE